MVQPSMLKRINSATKYPSILTYHALGAKGRLKDEVLVPFAEKAILTEKVDGTNARIVVFPEQDYFIGSREELLFAKGDRIINPELSIVETTQEVAEAAVTHGFDEVVVLFGEVYGGKIGPAKQYTSQKALGFRLFDVVSFDSQSWSDVLSMPPEQISRWRKNGGQTFWNEDRLQSLAQGIGVEVTPRLGEEEIPTDLQKTWEWLNTKFPEGTKVALDEGAKGQPEGIVARSEDRSVIAKLRFEDYKRTVK